MGKQFIKEKTCPECNGHRLKKESLFFKIDHKNISELAQLDIAELNNWFDGLETRISERQQKIGTEVIKEIRTRLSFLLDVGLEYLSLDRTSATLSGGGIATNSLSYSNRFSTGKCALYFG